MDPVVPQSEGRPKLTKNWIAKHYRQQRLVDSGVQNNPLTSSDAGLKYARWDWMPWAPPPVAGPVGAQSKARGEVPDLEHYPGFWSLKGDGKLEKAKRALGESRGDLPRRWPEGKEDTTERKAPSRPARGH